MAKTASPVNALQAGNGLFLDIQGRPIVVIEPWSCAAMHDRARSSYLFLKKRTPDSSAVVHALCLIQALQALYEGQVLSANFGACGHGELRRQRFSATRCSTAEHFREKNRVSASDTATILQALKKQYVSRPYEERMDVVRLSPDEQIELFGYEK